MKKTSFLVFFLLVFFLLAANAQKKKPNIIWLMSEDISLDLQCYGTPGVKTPNLNSMASKGVRFDNCFVTNSICSPSRSAMMVGTHQLLTNSQHHRSNRNIPLDQKFKPFTYWLKKQGYTTILGNHQVFSKGRKIDVNFKHKAIGKWDGKEQFGLFDKHDVFEKKDEPFFAQIQLKVTHRGDWWDDIRAKSSHPVNPDNVVLPPHYADHPKIRLDWAKYLDQIEYMDYEVGLIFEELKEKDMIDNTIVIFIGDNGRSNIRGKGYLHDPGLRIPLIIYYPKRLKGGQISKDVVSATDLTATILDFAGVEIPNYMTGKPVFNKEFKREYVFSARDLWDEIEEKSRSITSGNWKYIRNDKPKTPYDAHQGYLEFYRPAVHIMRELNRKGKLDKNQSFFFKKEKPKEELYNLENDPLELCNLIYDKESLLQLKLMRSICKDYEKQYEANSLVYAPVKVNTQELVEWVKKTKPKLYQKMLNGDEIGFTDLMKKFNSSLVK